ncbi:hypothetical protein ACHQM5_015373 [Ranunculus cassubicifolius]
MTCTCISTLRRWYSDQRLAMTWITFFGPKRRIRHRPMSLVRNYMKAVEMYREMIHEFMKQKEFKTEGYLGNALVDMYTKCGSMNLAREVCEARKLLEFNDHGLGCSWL